MSNFTHLHVHTEYSLLDGMNKIKDCVSRAKELGMDSIAITDHGVMYGTIQFYEECKAQGLNPIIGCEVYVAPGSRFEKSSTKSKIVDDNRDDRYHHLILLAENNKGLENLYKICSIGFIEGYYYKPRVDKEVLAQYHDGLICLSACLAGEIPRLIMKGEMEKAREAVLWYKDTFGENNFFLELQDHGIPEQRTVNMELVRISKECGIPMVATNDVHYTKVEDAKAHDVLVCIQTEKLITDEDRMIYYGGQYYLKSEEEMRKLFPYAQDAIDNTHKIAERCKVEIEFGVTKMPYVSVPDGYDAWTYLQYLCDKGMEERYPNDDGTIRKRLEYELGVIKKMGFVEYFLIVWDYINFARENGIPVGPGRGSAAGSVVSYCLHITNLDPLKYGLLFERFLNPERISMPDIDVDFCFERRGEVIDYVREKYGQDKVTQIVTFGTLAAKNVIRSVGKVMGFPYTTCDKIAKMIPKELNITIKKALEMNPDLQKLYNEDVEIKNYIDICMKLEGLPRHTSMHAAGVVIYREGAMNYVPLAVNKEGAVVTQYNMNELEHLGLLKMDFLGLRTLTVINDAVKMIEKNTGEKIDMDNIDYNDPKVLAMISTGDCDGVFQLESEGMQGFMKELKPQSLEDIIAGISLYRPGPMDFIPKYLKGKNDPANITYPCEELRSILEPTYGCIVYQEQVMEIVRKLGGYSMGQADNIRKAMSKKKQAVIDAERKSFIYGDENRNIVGCIKNGIDETVANEIYDSMVDFAKYAFNKSHAACYAVVGMQTAWLKYYYPIEYMAALMTSVIENPDKLKKYIHSAKQSELKMLPPNINKSFAKFVCEDGNIRFGLVGLKHVGWGVIEALVEEREMAGEFKSFEDFLERTTTFVDKRAIESLIRAGALDVFGYNRHTLMENFKNVLDQMKSAKSKGIDGQVSLFEMFGGGEEIQRYTIKEYPEYEKEELLQAEKEISGIYLSGHPLEDYSAYMKKRTSATLDKFVPNEDDEIEYQGDDSITVAGMLINSKITYTKKDSKRMMFASLEDPNGEIEIVVFPRQFEEYQEILKDGQKLLIDGTLQSSEKGVNVIANHIRTFAEEPVKVWIKIPTLNNTIVQEIGDMCSTGENMVILYAADKKQSFPLKASVSINGDVIQRLRDKFGENNVKLT